LKKEIYHHAKEQKEPQPLLLTVVNIICVDVETRSHAPAQKFQCSVEDDANKSYINTPTRKLTIPHQLQTKAFSSFPLYILRFFSLNNLFFKRTAVFSLREMNARRARLAQIFLCGSERAI
jgi:hypothetical protein